MRAALALLLVGLAAAAGAPTAYARDVPVGIYAEEVMTAAPSVRDGHLRAMSSLGLRVVRVPVYWADLERVPGAFDLRETDAMVLAAARHGLSVLPVLVSTPPSRTATATGTPDEALTGRSFRPPADPAAFGRFAAALVARYGRSGSLWVEHPALRPVPVTAWQIWNEPNIPYFWRSGPDPAAYAALLKAAAWHIRAADRTAQVVAAGLPDSGTGIRLDRFLAAMYAAGAKGSYDALAVHPYGADADDALALVSAVRVIMDRHGDAAGLWVTEAGWASGGPPTPFTVDEPTQARHVAALLEGLGAAMDDLDLRGVTLFRWHDVPPGQAGQGDQWPMHAGLLRADASAKPALLAVASALAPVDPTAKAGTTTTRRAAKCRVRVRVAAPKGRRLRSVRLTIAGERTSWFAVRRGSRASTVTVKRPAGSGRVRATATLRLVGGRSTTRNVTVPACGA